MDILLFIVEILILFYIVNKIIIKKKKKAAKSTEINLPVEEEITISELPLIGVYQKKWMFTFNEKDAYKKLLPIAQELGYTVFAKVRVLDLMEPIKGNPKYKTYLYKIQAKHVDFVLCDQKLVAKYIIELDDNSHEAEDRKQRDAFLDQTLSSVGYKVIHVKAITEDLKIQIQ